MADAKTLDEFLKGEAPSLREITPFVGPYSFYNTSGDSLEIYISNEPRVAERINSLFTVFVSRDDRSKVVGLVIKNIGKHFGGQSELKFLVAARKSKVAVLVRGAQLAQVYHYKRAEASEQTALIEKAVEDLGEIEIDVPELLSA